MSLVLADDYTQLTFHVLAHVARTDPGDLFNERHCEATWDLLSEDAQHRLIDDTYLLAQMAGLLPADDHQIIDENFYKTAKRTDLGALDHLPELHRSLAGPHGRAMPARILIGNPTPDDPISPAILAMHEYAVRTSTHLDYFKCEWDALTRAARWTAAAPEPLRAAHARWLASLDLIRLLNGVYEAGLVTIGDAVRLGADPPIRADLLRSL